MTVHSSSITTLDLPKTLPTSRILAVTRLHFVNRFTLIYQPLIILGAIFLINLAIWVIIILSTPLDQRGTTESHLGYSGAVFYIFIYALVIAVQAISRTFPFSLGYGVTRRNFSLGSSVAFLLIGIIFSAVLTIMSSIEIATDGWGVGGRMFAPDYFTNSSWLLRFVMYLMLFLFCLSIGSAAASMWVRWKVPGLISFFAVIAVILIGAVAIFTLGHHWVAFGDWVASQGSVGVTLWLLIPTAVAGLAGYLILQRATPKN
jgi:hypothetical protein